jgi:D-tyrosyl-tRNA(Tyr) deacylase
MRALLQRVKKASVVVSGETVGEIGKGLLVFLGVGANDTDVQIAPLVKKIVAIRMFNDENGKINHSLRDVGGSILVVSQFTLYADTSRGNRPGFSNAALPDTARQLYHEFCELMAKEIPITATGMFGADMEVSLVNDGPFTIMLNQE